MSNKEKFQGFKKELIEKNEKNYGKEMKERYGEENVKKYNEKFLNLTEEDYHKMEELSAKILEKLKEAYATEDPSSEEAQTLAAMHKEWLTFTWPSYSKEAHRGLAEMYVADERFKEHYDKVQEGGAEFLRDAIFEYTKQNYLYKLK